MEPIRVYQTDHRGIWLRDVAAFTEVLNGKHLYPAGTRSKMPPTLQANEAARTVGDAVDSDWEVIPDFEGVTYWTADGVEHKVNEIGAALPAGALLEKPAPTAAQLAAKRVLEIKAELQQIDADGARPAREIALALVAGGTAPEAAVSKVQTLETQAQTLRDELATLSEVA